MTFITATARIRRIDILKRFFLKKLVEDPIDGSSFDNDVLNHFNALEKKYRHEKLSPMEKFKLGAISDEFSDEEIEREFYELEVSSDRDIQEILGTIAKHRPTLRGKLDQKFLSRVAS